MSRLWYDILGEFRGGFTPSQDHIQPFGALVATSPTRPTLHRILRRLSQIFAGRVLISAILLALLVLALILVIWRAVTAPPLASQVNRIPTTKYQNGQIVGPVTVQYVPLSAVSRVTSFRVTGYRLDLSAQAQLVRDADHPVAVVRLRVADQALGSDIHQPPGPDIWTIVLPCSQLQELGKTDNVGDDYIHAWTNPKSPCVPIPALRGIAA
ncbi:MAG TPA: hypothetical protein VI322_05620 [Candidatus Saccharimonadia bacterium]